MRSALVRLFAAGIVLLSVPARAVPDGADAPATQRVESSDHRVGLDVPADWKIEYEKADDCLVYALARVPPDALPLYVEVDHVPGFRSARAQAYVDRGAQAARYGGARGEVGLDPVPHLVFDAPRPGKLAVHASVYRVLARNGFTVVFHCAEKTWPVVKDACLRAAQTLTSKIEEWPARPTGYKFSERDGYEYLVQPGVKDADVAALHQAVLDQEKRYAQWHGPVPKDPEDRPVVVVSADIGATRAGTGVDTYGCGFAAEMLQGRLLAVPLRKDDPAARGQLADWLVMLFHAQSYSMACSPWLCNGERLLANAEATVGKPLPSLPADFLAQLPRTLVTFDTLVHKPLEDRWNEDAVYIALFRVGPQVYRDAFSAYLKDLRDTGDWETAEEKHLLSLDQEKLRAAAQDLAKSGLKPVKTK